MAAGVLWGLKKIEYCKP